MTGSGPVADWQVLGKRSAKAAARRPGWRSLRAATADLWRCRRAGLFSSVCPVRRRCHALSPAAEPVRATLRFRSSQATRARPARRWTKPVSTGSHCRSKAPPLRPHRHVLCRAAAVRAGWILVDNHACPARFHPRDQTMKVNLRHQVQVKLRLPCLNHDPEQRTAARSIDHRYVAAMCDDDLPCEVQPYAGAARTSREERQEDVLA